MRVAQIINWHRHGGGSDFIAKATSELLREAGHEVVDLGHDSCSYEGTAAGKVRAALAGVYSPAAISEVRAMLQRTPPDVVHVHEVYPYHSPWVIKTFHKAGVPVVMTCHDFRVSCPVATHLYANKVCTRCAGGNTAWCAVKNCRGNRAESAAFAMRAGVANAFQLYTRYVTSFIAPSRFMRDSLVKHKAIPEERFTVVPNLIAVPSEEPGPRTEGAYAAFAGRITPEKGIGTLLEAARRTRIPVRIAGGPVPEALRENTPENVTWLGHLEGEELAAFYRKARFLVVPSFFEPFGLVVGEAMLHGLPVLGANSGALPELIQPNENGMLFAAGDAQELAEKLVTLWENPALCRRLSQAAKQSARQKFCPKTYRSRIMGVYEDAIRKMGAQSNSARANHARKVKVKT